MKCRKWLSQLYLNLSQCWIIFLYTSAFYTISVQYPKVFLVIEVEGLLNCSPYRHFCLYPVTPVWSFPVAPIIIRLKVIPSTLLALFTLGFPWGPLAWLTLDLRPWNVLSLASSPSYSSAQRWGWLALFITLPSVPVLTIPYKTSVFFIEDSPHVDRCCIALVYCHVLCSLLSAWQTAHSRKICWKKRNVSFTVVKFCWHQ